MREKFLFSVTFLFALFLMLFLHGTISLSSKVLPPFGAFLNPFQGVWANTAQNEEKDFELNLPGLTDKVDIVYDDRRVPHIFAQNMGDALYAQGFVEAQNRLFQMEFLAMAASGSLSSVMGEATLGIDLDKRRRGMTQAAENSLAGWEKHDDYNQAYRYIDGVNAYIHSLSPADYPLEFKLLNMTPEEWTPLKTAYIFKQMSLTLAGHNDDIEYTNLLFHLGTEDFNFLYPQRESIENPVIPSEKPYVTDSLVQVKAVQQAAYNGDIQHAYMESRNKNAGSNSWGLAGSRTSTGKPIFCNDPHLSLGLPSIWFEVHIHTPECNAYGVSFPGFPGIMIGFNEDIAWGETNVGQDVEDLFLIQWTDDSRKHYWLDSQKVAATYRLEEIQVKGGKTVMDTVWYTHWGPVYFRSLDGKHDMALRWLCHDEPDTDEFNTFIDAMKCRNYEEFQAATERYIAPAQNFGFASRDGDIALRVNGRLPAKLDQDGRFVEWGHQSAHNWQAFIPKKQVPQIVNPERGFISSANQVSADKTYPYYFNGEFERYRNRTINNKCAAPHKGSRRVNDNRTASETA
jgi:penicillin amidase